ncbi:uncharacterized protein LOC116158607 isoform X1 [Photinus pyralis]|uniref:uncharacterized protein LOC116158607 isoform X1 n=1 Tax=Photinus pyralis TaxID=7054 RepID=UPI0012671888|nr:uncharacterized protein LOC116158607 isoform X1 [Photinus pyralis]
MCSKMIHNLKSIIIGLGAINILSYHWVPVRCQSDDGDENNSRVLCITDTNSNNSAAALSIDATYLQENEHGWINAVWDKRDQLYLKWTYNNTFDEPIAHFIINIVSGDDSCYQYILPGTEEHINCTYSYLVKFTNKCYSTDLTIVVTALSNDAISLELLNVSSPPRKPTFDSTVNTANITTNTMLFYIPRQKWIESKPPHDLSIFIYVILIETNSETKLTDDVVDKVLHAGKTGNTSTSTYWIAAEFQHNTTDTRRLFLIGDESIAWSQRLNVTIKNRLLRPNTTYTITTVLINEYKQFQRYSVYKFTTSTARERKGFVMQPMHIIMIILVIISLPLVVCCFLRLKRDECTLNDLLLCFVCSTACICRSSCE